MVASQMITEHLPNKVRGTQFFNQIMDLGNISIDIATNFRIIIRKTAKQRLWHKERYWSLPLTEFETFGMTVLSKRVYVYKVKGVERL